MYRVRAYSTYVTTTRKPRKPHQHADPYSAVAPWSHVRACVRACVRASLCLFSILSSLSFSFSLRLRLRLFMVYIGEDGRGIHHLAPHGRYTSNTLRVSQLTPSQTFHFVVQRARHGVHDGSHKWKPSLADPMLQFVSCFHGGPRWDARARARASARTRGAHPWAPSYPEDRSHFCANASGPLNNRPRNLGSDVDR
jgi:hypothetical protein